MKIVLKIPGVPVAQGRARMTTRGGHIRSYDPEKSVNFKNLVMHIAQEERKRLGLPLFEGALKASLYFFFPIPKSQPKKFKEGARLGMVVHTKRPDGDNIAKAILDACNQVLFNDDAQVAALHIYKLYGEIPQAVVQIESWEGFPYEKQVELGLVD